MQTTKPNQHPTRRPLAAFLMLAAAAFGIVGPSAPTAHADEEDPRVARIFREAKAAFDTWFAEKNPFFDEAWAAVQELEGRARPIFEEGTALKERGNTAQAEAKFLEARAILLSGEKAHFVPLNVGLSYEISTQLAELYHAEGRRPQLKRELPIVRYGRPWSSEDNERGVYLHNQLEVQHWIYNHDQNAGDNARSLSDRRKTRRIINYLGVTSDYDGVSRYTWSEGSALRDSWRDAKGRVERLTSYELFRELGGEDYVHQHDPAFGASGNSPEEKTISVKDAAITRVRGRTATFDFRAPREEAYNCRETNRIAGFTVSGRPYYEQECPVRTVRGGHQLTVTLPRGLRVRAGDRMTFLVDVERIQGDQGGTVVGGTAVVISAVRGRQMLWASRAPNGPRHGAQLLHPGTHSQHSWR